MTFDKYEYKKDFIFKDGRIHFTPRGETKIFKPKKLTGSRLGAVFGNDSFKTPFQLWCEIFGFFKLEQDTYFLEAGTIIEPKLKEYSEKKMNKKFVNYDPKSISFDLFPENPIFGGIPDGEEYDENGNLISILEIKTAQMDKYKWVFLNNQMKLKLENGDPILNSRGDGLKKWFKNGEVIIPSNYIDQISLYLYLRNITKGYFCVAFIKHEDYKKAKDLKFTSEFNNYKGYDLNNFKLDINEHILVWKEFELNKEEFEKKYQMAKEWYVKHVYGRVSPKLSTSDLEWFRYGYPDLF